MEARPYQQKAIDELIEYYKTGKRPLLHLATGAGKTFIFCRVMKGCYEKGNPCIMVVRGRSLVQQASKRLNEMGVPHGVFMANEYDGKHIVQIVSIDTVRSKKIFPKASMVIIDEAHYAVSESFKEFIAHYPDAFFLSVSATPYPREGLKHLADHVIYPISIQQLFEQKWLCPPKYIGVPENRKMDLKKVKITGGDFNERQSFEAFETQKIYGDVASHWVKFCKGESSLCFAINLAHGARLVETYESVGARAILIDAQTALDTRLELINKLETGKIDVIVNVGTMTTGVDIPSLRNLVLCRPTASKVLYVQMLGRGTRIWPGKEYFKVIDHVGNIYRHGFIEEEEKADLEAKNLSRVGETPTRTCPDCLAVMHARILICPSCGKIFQSENKEKELVLCDLEEIKFIPKKKDFKIRAQEIWEDVQSSGHSVGSVWKRLQNEFSEDEMRRGYMSYRKIKEHAERINYDTSENRLRYLARTRMFAVASNLETVNGCGEDS